MLIGQLPRREHDLPQLAVDRVPVHVDVGELVVGADLLELGEAREERPVVPQPDVLDGEAVALERGRRELLLGGELLLLDRGEPVGLPGHANVVLDVRPLGHQLVGGDLEALEERRPHADAPRPRHSEHHQPGHEKAPAGPRDLEQAGTRAEEGEGGEGAQHGQGGVHVGVRRAEDHPARRIDELEAIQPEAHRAQEKEHGAQGEEMGASARGEARSLRGEDEAPEEDVGGHAQEQRADDEGHGSAVEKAPQRQVEDEESNVATEERIGAAERRPVEVAQHHVPRRAGPEPGQNADHGDDGQEQLSNQRLEDGAAGQAELVVELPQHVRSRGAGGEPEVAVDEQEDHPTHSEEQPSAERQHGGEDVGEADLVVPEPVGVQRHRLAGPGQHDEADQQPEAEPGRAPSIRHREPPPPGAASSGGVRTRPRGGG